MATEVRQGDCLEVVRGLEAGSVDLVYVDPPFFTQKTHSLVTRDRSTKFEFSDQWKSRTEYLDFLRERLGEFRRVLKTTGSLLFHCDTNASHHIRCLLAAELLYQAGQSKQPATMVLVVTDTRQPAGLFNLVPPEVLLVNSTATELLERLAERGLGRPHR